MDSSSAKTRFPPLVSQRNSTRNERLFSKSEADFKPSKYEDDYDGAAYVTPTAYRAKGRTATREESLVVGTSSTSPASHTGDNPQLPQEWTNMRVNQESEEHEIQRTKLEWENQIAKHILSLFATSHAVKNINEGAALLDFADVDKSTAAKAANIPLDSTLSYLHTKPNHRPVDELAPLNGDTDQEKSGNEKRKKKKTKRKKKQQKSGERELDQVDASDEPKVKSGQKKVVESDYAIAERVLLRIQAEAEALEVAAGKSKSRVVEKHRITNTIKLKDGSELIVRGSPRCYPIWFVSTADVYADWTVLPGGVKLQAHLNALYDQVKFTEYLGILETMITEMFRKVRYGEEEFALGSFGHSGTNSSSNTADNSARNSRRNSRLTSGGEHTHRSDQSSRRPSHTGGSGFEWETTTKSSSAPGVGTVSSPPPPVLEEDSQLVPPVVWEDMGSEGLVPMRKIDQRKKKNSAEVTGTGTGTGTGAFKPDERRESHSTIGSIGSQLLGKMTGIDTEAHPSDPPLPVDQLTALWKQLILCAIAMGILYLERKKPDLAMTLFKRAEEWSSNDEHLPVRSIRKELRAHCRDAISYYFFKRKKSIAALGYSTQALELYEEVENVDGIGVCLLHIAAVHSQIGNFKESHKMLFQFLAMVESGRLATTDATPKQLCMVAIGYHNLAVIQLKLAMPDLACKNSQNARKIARLCLSYSNRWIDAFQYTHEIAVADLKYELRTKRAAELTPAQLTLVIELSEALFDPYSDYQLT